MNDTTTTNNSNHDDDDDGNGDGDDDDDDDDDDDLEVAHPHSRSWSNIPVRIGSGKPWFSRTNNKLNPHMTCPYHIAKATYRSKFHFPKYVYSVHGCKAVMLKYIKVLRKADPL